MAVAMLFAAAELTGTVIGLFLMSCSAPGNDGERHLSENEANTNESALITDIHEAREERHQDTSHEEGIR